MGAYGEFSELLAKGLQKGATRSSSAGETLAGHTHMVITAFKAMFGTRSRPTHLARCWLRFFNLSLDYFDDFWLQTLVASALHDIGKANKDFQLLVRYKLSDAQLIRHEHLSGLLICLPELKAWLEQIEDLDFWPVFSAVVGHHLKVKDATFAWPQTDRTILTVYPEGVKAIVRLLASELGITAPQLDIPAHWNTNDSVLGQSIPALKEVLIEPSLREFEKNLKEDSNRRILLSAVRTALILADSAGSGLSREMKDESRLAQAIIRWLEDVFDEQALQNGYEVETHVIEKRVAQIRANGKEFNWGYFQLAAAHLPERSLLLAACGSGKTLAAWKWIQAQLAKRPRSRVIFLYPTRATATEGFRDYVSWAPETDAGLLHGTSAYELDSLFENPQTPQDDRVAKDFTTQERLFALGYWSKRMISATVDQFLGFMQHVYASVCLMPLLVDSVVVIDEVHSFDHGMFSALKQFLVNFNVPVLCMTASLPPERQKQLAECDLQVFPTHAGQFEDLRLSSELPRYRLQRLDAPERAYGIVQSGLAAGKSILWVVNTVDRCQRLAQELDAICYHSRFKLDDRKYWHQQVISAFQQKGQARLAITTQVCEMSLDLDADILITELAPIPAMIQRMGRCNRHARKPGMPPGLVYVYAPEGILPYRREELAEADAFLHELESRVVSQVDLEQGLQRHGNTTVRVDKYSGFLQSGPWAFASDHHLRDSLDLSVDAVLDSEIDAFLNTRQRRSPIDGFVLPAPVKLARAHPKLAGLFYQTVSASSYSPRFGLLKLAMEAQA